MTTWADLNARSRGANSYLGIRRYRDPNRNFWRGYHVLYRFYDASDRLLYIGASSDITERTHQHRRATPWYPEVARMVCRLHPTRKALFEAETAAIRNERPLYNERHALTA